MKSNVMARWLHCRSGAVVWPPVHRQLLFDLRHENCDFRGWSRRLGGGGAVCRRPQSTPWAPLAPRRRSARARRARRHIHQRRPEGHPTPRHYPTTPPPPPPHPPAPAPRARAAPARGAGSPVPPFVSLPSALRPNRAFAWPATPSQAGAEGLPLCAALALRAAAQRDNGRTMTAATLLLRVAQARQLNPLIRMLRLCAEDGGALPGFAAGAHIRVQVSLPDGKTDWGHYSLIDFATTHNATSAGDQCLSAVRNEPGGRGGSRFMQQRLKEGDSIAIEAPKNEFPLHTGPGGSVRGGGGTGATPLPPRAARRRAEGAAVRMHYAGRSRDLMAFLPELQNLLGDDLRVHADAEAGAPLDIDALLDGVPVGDHLYVCGPGAMLDAMLGRTRARGWEPGRVHWEIFAAPAAAEGDQPFEVELARSGQRFTVPAGQSILDCLIENGCDPMFDCKRGACGVCAVPVLEGGIDHRDHVLSAREKAQGSVMQICISRAKGTRLVLDI